jgi:tetratricopeptide (TPR) repeat protein
MLGTLGRANMNLGLFDEGITLLRGALASHEAALPPEDPTIGSDLSDLSNALRAAGKLDEAGPMIDRSIEILTRHETPRSDALPVALYRKGEWLMSEGRLKDADSLVTVAIRMLESTAGGDTADLVNMYNLGGTIEERMGDPRGAEQAYLRAIDLAIASGGEEQTSVVLLHRNLAAHYVHTHEPEKATPHADEAERVARKIFPPDHPYIAAVLGARADILQYQGRLGEAAAIREEDLRILKKSFGPVHPKVAGELNALGGLYQSQGKLDLAITRMREARDMKRELYGEDNDQTAESAANLARFYQYAGEVARADSAYQKAIPVLERRARARPSFIAYAEMGYANLCRDRGRLTEADTLYTRAEALLDTTQVALRGYFGECLADHALLRSMEGRNADAEAMVRAAAHIEEGPGEGKYFGSLLLQWAVIRARAGNADGARALIRRAIDRGATEDELSEYKDLARLRGHAGSPAPMSPANGVRPRDRGPKRPRRRRLRAGIRFRHRTSTGRRARRARSSSRV